MSPRSRSTLVLAVSVTAAALAAASPAAADSIAYVKDGNVWLTTSDGTRQFQVTSDGGYTSVSQSDLGTMAALRGDRIRTLSRDGTVLHDIVTAHSSTNPGTRFRGPFDPAISPDGSRIAYSWYYTQTGETTNCNPSTGCQTVYGRQGTNYVSPDGSSPFDRPGWNEQTGWVGPSWTANGETLLSDPIQVGNADVVVHTPGDDTNGITGAVSPWFFDPTAAGGLADGEQTTDRTKLAFVTGQQHETLYLYRARGGYPTIPKNCYRLNDGNGRISSPSWSPDGATLAYADASGVNVLPLPSFAQDCGVPTAAHTKRLLVAGATSPDWGPADVPPARVTPAAAPRSDASSGPAGPGSGAAPQAVTVTAGAPLAAAVTLPRPATLSSALARGLRIRVSGAEPGTRTVTASVKGTTVARARLRVRRDGTGEATLRFTRAATRSLRPRSSVLLTVRAGELRATLTLRRRAHS